MENKTKITPPEYKDSVGIRATLNNMGFSNESIGYDDKNNMVTLNGKALIKPKYTDAEAGITYSPVSDIQKSLVDYHASSKNPIVRVSDEYAKTAGKYGLSADALTYGNGKVSIGGTPLSTLYNDSEGKAWAWKNDIDTLSEKYASDIGARTPESIVNYYDSRYLSDIEDMISDIYNRNEFRYNPDTDPVYKAYREKYLREGSRASEDAMAKYSALTGGYVNSAAVTAGAMADRYYAQQLSDKIPELYEMAYKRYYDKYMNDVDVLKTAIDVYKTAYNNESEANKTAVNNANAAAKSAKERDNAAYARDYDDFKRYWEDIDNRNKNELDTQKLAEYSLKNYGTSLDNTEKEIYLEYYRRLLDSELDTADINNKKTTAEIYKIYNK